MEKDSVIIFDLSVKALKAADMVIAEKALRTFINGKCTNGNNAGYVS